MSDSNANQMSRRDWFRLRTPAKAVNLGEGRTDTLSVVPDPENHGGMDLSELPPLREAQLTPEQVLALIDDVSSQASNVQLMVRGKRPAAEDTRQLLTQAVEGLFESEYAKLQIRYSWRGSLWIDTLERQTDHIRLVRIEHTGMS